jgi:hypothetical protein
VSTLGAIAARNAAARQAEEITLPAGYQFVPYERATCIVALRDDGSRSAATLCGTPVSSSRPTVPLRSARRGLVCARCAQRLEQRAAEIAHHAATGE